MSATMVMTQRPDIDIQDDIDHLIAHYPPLQKDRRAIRTVITDGIVTVSGYVQSPVTRRYFLDRLPTVPGVIAVHAEYFYDDETIRIDTGKVIPRGVILAKVLYGTVVLAGKLPEGMSIEQLAAQVGAVPGVSRVITSFAG